jgi:hypothetical protein
MSLVVCVTVLALALAKKIFSNSRSRSRCGANVAFLKENLYFGGKNDFSKLDNVATVTAR